MDFPQNYLKLVGIFLIFFIPNFLFSVEIKNTISTNTENKSFLELDLRYFEDKTESMQIDRILALPSEKWIQSKSKSPNFGYTKSIYWVRIQLPENISKDKRFLEIEYPLIDKIDLFTLNGKSPSLYESTGDLRSFKDRKLKYRTFIFDTSKFSSNDVLIRFQNDGPMKFPISILSETVFFNNSINEMLTWGFYFGLLVIMVLYNLFVYISVRDKNYLFYVLYIISAISAQLTLHGFLSFFIQDSPSLVNISLPILLNIDFFFGVMFCANFLETKTYTPYTHKIVLLTISTILLSLGTALFSGYAVSIRLSMLLLISIPILFFIAGINSYRKGLKQARFFLLAWIPLLISLILISLDSMNLISSSFFTYHSVEIGTVLEVVLLSLALADRINIMKKEKENALQEKLIESEKVANLSHVFKKFVPFKFLEYLGLDDITKVKLGDSIEIEMTILFADIRSFTSISEKMTPYENFHFLNDFLKNIEPIFSEHHGYVDKYLGDGVMALFHRHPGDAINAAIESIKKLSLYNQNRIDQGLDPIKIGIGINTGKLMLGTIGTENRMENTVISDAVNLASRIEGLTKLYDCPILISEQTLFKLDDPSLYNYRIIDRVKVKGKSDDVSIIEIIDGNQESIALKKVNTKAQFEKGIHFYISKELDQSEEKFKEVLKENPDDYTAKIYLNRIAYFQEHGVPMDWSGIEALTNK